MICVQSRALIELGELINDDGEIWVLKERAIEQPEPNA